MNRHEQMRQQTMEFHRQHPEVWKLFVKLSLDRIEKGFRHYGARAIFNRIRWEMDVPDYEKGQAFKLNNNYSPFYARAFMRRFPQHDGFFQLRRQLSQESPVRSHEPRPEALH